MTDAELLALVDTAITGVLTHGQALGAPGGGSWTKADLPTLNTMRGELQAKVAAAARHPLRSGYALAPYRGAGG